MKEEFMNYFKSNNYKYWVLKIEDFVSALTESELLAFNEMLRKLEEYRISTNRTPSNNYWIVNRDDTPIDNLEDFLKAVQAEHCLEKKQTYYNTSYRKSAEWERRNVFYSEEFYTDPNLTLEVFNALNDSKYIIDKDMYGSGTFLQMEVQINEETKNILSKVIGDIDAYIDKDRKDYLSSKQGLALTTIQDDHEKIFGVAQSIRWDHSANEFVLLDNLD